MPYVSRLPYAPGDFFCRPAHCCAEATGKKSQTRPVLRLGRRADGVWRSVFSSAVRGTRPPIEKKYCYFLYFPSLPRCAARAFSPQEPATLARRSLRRRCSGVGLPRFTASSALSYASLEVSSQKKPMSHAPPSRRSVGKIVGESRTKHSRTRAFRVRPLGRYQDSLGWSICIVPCSAELVKFIAIIRAN